MNACDHKNTTHVEGRDGWVACGGCGLRLRKDEGSADAAPLPTRTPTVFGVGDRVAVPSCRVTNGIVTIVDKETYEAKVLDLDDEADPQWHDIADVKSVRAANHSSLSVRDFSGGTMPSARRSDGTLWVAEWSHDARDYVWRQLPPLPGTDGKVGSPP